jgi:hypothetical protein
MDDDELVVISAVKVSINAAIAAVTDGRAYKQGRANIFTIRNNTWMNVIACDSDGLFRANLRVRRSTFESILDVI